MARWGATEENEMSKLTETALYIGDNGRCFCGRLRCSGSTAFHTGRDLSGQRAHRVTAEELRENADWLVCEGCGYYPSLVPVEAD